MSSARSAVTRANLRRPRGADDPFSRPVTAPVGGDRLRHAFHGEPHDRPGHGEVEPGEPGARLAALLAPGEDHVGLVGEELRGPYLEAEPAAVEPGGVGALRPGRRT